MSRFLFLAITCLCCLQSNLIKAQTSTITINSIIEPAASSAPAADFAADVTYTCDGTVGFTDMSTNTPTSWLWLFGDGGVSTQQNPTYTYANSGVYNVTLIINNSAGVDTIEKTAYMTVEKPKVTSVVDGETCPGMTATLSATNGSGALNWYDGSSTLVHTGPTFTTPALSATTTYFVEEVITASATLYAGPVDGATVGNGGYHGGNFTGGVNFTALDAFDLISVWVDADGGGNRTIYLYDGHIANGNNVNNTILDQVTVNIPDGQSRVQINFSIPSAGDYSLAGNQMDLFRNNNGAAVYPYILTDVVEMVSATTTNNGFFYYFYNWEVEVGSTCNSAQEQITARVVEANFTSASSGGVASFMDASTGATSWFWDFGDGNTSAQQNPMHTFATNGPHMVTLSINNGVCSKMDSVTVSVGIEQIADDMTLAIFPNPASNETTLSFSQDLPEDLQVELIGMDGKVLLQTMLPMGRSTLSIDVSQLPSSMYMIRMYTNEINDVRKIMVNHN